MQCVCQRPLAIRSASRAFSTSARRTVGLQLNANDERVVLDTVPPWPYGPTRLYKQSAQGLYGGQRILFGNNTSEKRAKTRRTWLPNIRTKRLFSKALGRGVHLKVTTRVMRTIDKLGGLDEYLLGEKEARIKELGEAGWWLRWAIMQTDTVKQRYAAQRIALGLSPAEVDAAPQQLSSTEEEASSEDLAEMAEEAQEEELQEGEEPFMEYGAPSLLDTLEDNKKKLLFRVGYNKYVQLRKGQWFPIVTQRSKILEGIYALSPTAALKHWDEPWNRQGLNQNTFFKKRAQLYEQCKEAYRTTKPFEQYNKETLPAGLRQFLIDSKEKEKARKRAIVVADDRRRLKMKKLVESQARKAADAAAANAAADAAAADAAAADADADAADAAADDAGTAAKKENP